MHDAVNAAQLMKCATLFPASISAIHLPYKLHVPCVCAFKSKYVGNKGCCSPVPKLSKGKLKKGQGNSSIQTHSRSTKRRWSRDQILFALSCTRGGAHYGENHDVEQDPAKLALKGSGGKSIKLSLCRALGNFFSLEDYQ